MKPANRTNPLSLILGALLVVALLVLAWVAWQWSEEGNRANRLDQEVTDLRQQTADPVAPTDNADDAPATDTTEANGDDSQQILAAAQAYEKAQPANQGTELRYEIDRREGDFARVSVSSGHALVLKKVDNAWTVVLAGQQFEDADLQRFGVPASLVRE